MGTLIGLMHVSTAALQANQSALTATAENISNQNTAGYTRRVTGFSSGDSVDIGGRSTSTGVTATVTAQRDTVLQKAVWQANEASNASSARSTALGTLQSLFAINSDGDDAAGINVALSNFFSGMNALAATPSDSTSRQTAFTNTQALATTLNRAAAQLAAQRGSLDQQVTSSVAQVNGLLTAVAGLNQQIVAAGAATDTSAFQDQRDQAITQLSALVDISTVSAKDGSTGISLSDGTSLVSGAAVTALAIATVNGKTQIFSGTTEVTDSIHRGTIGGVLQVRDTDIPTVTAQLDGIASAVASAVNTQNAAGTDPNGDPGSAVFAGTTAATLRVALSSSAGIAASSDGANAAAMAAIGTLPLIAGVTASGAFSATITRLGETASAAATDNTAAAAVLTQTSTQLANVSGVSLDTEAANLTQYQRSYEAAAKVLSIVNELLAQAINLGTETSVS